MIIRCSLTLKSQSNFSNTPSSHVMDALAAVGLVGNILQFIDFSSKLIARANQLYNSNEGALLENIDIEKTTNDLSVLSNKLMNNLSVESTALQNLSLSCNAIAATLLEKLQKMKVKGQPTRWKSMRKVISTAWNEKELLELERRLSRYREELNLRIVVDLRYAYFPRRSNCANPSTEEINCWKWD